jgi:DNA-binding Lrp family transcriptional regulator
MVESAYVLINTAIGKTGEVTKEISKIKGVIKAQSITGQYDIIAIIEADNMNELGKIVANEIQNVSGVIGTITCPTIDLG